MIEYPAYTRIKRTFASFEEGVSLLENHPITEGKHVTAVSILTGENSYGASVEVLDGLPTENTSSVQAFIITVVHEVFGKTFTFEYMVEFSLIPIPEPEEEVVPESEEEEEIEDEEGDVESGLGGEEVDPQPGEGSGEVVEDPGIPD